MSRRRSFHTCGLFRTPGGPLARANMGGMSDIRALMGRGERGMKKRITGVIAGAFLIAACAGPTPAEQLIPDLTEIYRIVAKTLEAEAAGAEPAAATEEVGPPPTNTPRLSSTPSPTDAPALDDPPEEILALERKGYDFQWQADHWESRSMNRGSVFYFYPDRLFEFEPGFGYTSTFDLDEHAINVARRDFFSAFGLDPGADIWMLQLGEAILTDGETDGKSCRGNLCCLFTSDYPEYRFYCTLN